MQRGVVKKTRRCGCQRAWGQPASEFHARRSPRIMRHIANEREREINRGGERFARQTDNTAEVLFACLLLFGLRLWNASTARDGTWELPLSILKRLRQCGCVARPVGRRRHYADSRSMRVQTRTNLPAHSHKPLPTQVENWCGIRTGNEGTKKKNPSATHTMLVNWCGITGNEH